MKTINYKNHTVKITFDPDPINPRKDYDHFGTILCPNTRKYNLSDRKTCLEEIENITNNPQWNIFLPVYLYDHGGITISTSPFSCPWDSGQVGIIYATSEDIQKEFGITPDSIERAKKLLESEILEFDQYLRGECYCYEITDKDGDQIESCCGFLGPIEYVESEAKRVIDSIIKSTPQQLELF